MTADRMASAALSPEQREPGKPVSRALAVALSSAAFVVPLLLSRSTSPTPDHPRVLFWYRLLRQPRFKPPDIAVPLAWMAIESCLAVASYRLVRRPASVARTRSLAWLAGNVVGIGAWSRLFFGSRNLPASTLGAAALVVSGAAYVAEAKKTDTTAAAVGVPFVTWVAFATVLTAAIWRKNR